MIKQLLLAACCLAVLGCAHPGLDPAAPQPEKAKSARRVRNDENKKFNSLLDTIKTVGLVTPDVIVYELTPGGIGEIIDEWSDEASAELKEAVTRELKARHIAVKPITTAAADKAKAKNTKYMYRAVAESLNWNTAYRMKACSEIEVCPDYCLGPVGYLFKDRAVDALFFVLAYNDVTTDDSDDSNDTVKPAGPAEDQVLISPGVEPNQFGPNKDHRYYALVNGMTIETGTYVSMALVDRQGNVLWYAGKATRKDVDLRDREDVDEMTKLVFKLFRAKERK